VDLIRSYHTGHSACQNYCTLCAQSGHRQKRGTCPYRVCNTCGETGHSARECNPRCKACGSSDHRNSSSFACPEHKCSKCKGALDPKGHNKNNCPQILSTICTLCEEVGHDEERCPTRPCPACGNRTHKSPMHFECPEHICATCSEKGHNRTNCPTTQCETCGLFGHLPNDCPFVILATLPNFRMYVTARLAHSSVFRFHPTNNCYEIVKHSLPFATSMTEYFLCSSPAQPGLRTRPQRQR